MVSLVPAGFGLAGVFLIGFYRLDRVVHGRISRVLARRRQRTSSPPIHTR
jgi:Na+/melibiose symporter-like transporter